MSMSDLSEATAERLDQSTTGTEAGAESARQLSANFMFATQKLMLEEWVFAGNEMFERTKIEMHLFSEFASKIAGAHSIKDIRSLYEECGKHQVEFVRRDCDRLLRHSEHVIEAASKLFKSHPLD